ncbi:MAG: hypothetical protein ACREQV_08295 [Candidatus Binatia bacterium]
MKLSVKALTTAVALFEAISFLFVALMNLILRPYGGAHLAMLTSLYPGYDPAAGPFSIILGTLYALIAGAVAGALLAWLYNLFVDMFGD